MHTSSDTTLIARCARLGWALRPHSEGWELRGNGSPATFGSDASLAAWLERMEMGREDAALTPYYEANGIQIWHGDCRDVLPRLTEYAVVVSDVPYGRALRSGMNGAHGDCRIENDETTELRDWMLSSITTPAIVFGSPFIARPTGVTPNRVLIWDKGEHVGMGDLSWPWKPNYEEIYVIGDGFIGPRSGSVLKYLAVAGTVAVVNGRQHPTEKPEALMRALILKCPAGVVLDPFMGSGTTLRAAKNLGRRAIGIEIEERYCEIAAKRLQQEVMELV